jgi:hypothetical protein
MNWMAASCTAPNAAAWQPRRARRRAVLPRACHTSTRAWRSAQTTGIVDALPELHRLRGELLRMQGADARQVEACYLQALDVAREQGTRSLELRAATSLARLWRSEGRRAAARELLGNLYSHFTEGFDTGDLRAARALLAEL